MNYYEITRMDQGLDHILARTTDIREAISIAASYSREDERVVTIAWCDRHEGHNEVIAEFMLGDEI